MESSSPAIPEQLREIISSQSDILGGTPCFSGTRVPVATFLDHVESGISLDEFLAGYSSVQRSQALAVLEWFSDTSRRSMGLDIAS